MTPPRLKLVSATRSPTIADFTRDTLLGRSLSLFPDSLLPELAIRLHNVGEGRLGLSAFYNQVIAETPMDVNLLFVHDDVFIHDVFLKQRLEEAFRRFDIVGLAGSRNADLTQPSWALAFDDALTPLGWQSPDTKFSGAVSHALGWKASVGGAAQPNPSPELSVYGETPDFVTLLDGLFLAVQTATAFARAGDDFKPIGFDERFDFHLYDIDFCRRMSNAGATLGTWPILVSHGSGGAYGSAEFKNAAREYRRKWNVADITRELRPRPAHGPSGPRAP